MAHVILLVNAASPDKIGLRWSDGAGWFDPYFLGKVESQEFLSHVAAARAALKLMATVYLTWVDPKEQTRQEQNKAYLEQTCQDLARCGYRLYCDLFQTDSDRRPEMARHAESWLRRLRSKDDVETLEVVVEEGEFVVPWTVVYDEDPTGRSFSLGGPNDPAALQPWSSFWGLRYRLGSGKRIDPLRRVSAPVEPRLVVVVDLEVENGLDDEEHRRLTAFYADHNIAPCRTFEEVNKRLAPGQGRAHVLYWMGHANRNGLDLSGESVTPSHLSDLLKREDRDEGENAFPGLIFFNTCQSLTITPPAKGMTDPPSFTDVVHARNLSGCIGTEAVTVDVFANKLGLEFLEAFLYRDLPSLEADAGVGAVLRKLREVPLGLLYAAHCPPRLRRQRPTPTQQTPVTIGLPRPGNPLNEPLAPLQGVSELPALPYRSLEYYDEKDRVLFSGRAGDVMRFSQILDTEGTRVVLLHGESGVGKTSFLLAGVLPYLGSNACLGFAVQPRLILRSTSDLVGQVAVALFHACQQSVSPPRPQGEPATEIALHPLVAAYPDVNSLRAALCADAGLLAVLLAKLGEMLPGAPVLVIDQSEEVFTLARTLDPKEALANRKAALEMLRLASEAAGNFKIIISLRTEYYGRFVAGLRSGVRQGKGVREYLLTDLDEARLSKAILRPTTLPQYRFRFDDGVAEGLARDVVRFCRNRLDSVLPLAQVICAQLYERIDGREDRTVRSADVEATGGVKGAIRRHVERLIDRELSVPHDREAFRDLLTKLYLEQPDGTLTTGMMPVARGDAKDSVEASWTGWGLEAEEMIQRMEKPGVRLLRISVLPQGESREQRCVSLGHDAIASVAKEWKQRAERRMWMMRLAGVAAVALAMVFLAVYAWNQADYARKQEQEAKEQKKAVEEQKKAVEKQKDVYEGALARTSLRPLSQVEGPLTDAEIEALTQLAGWRDSPGEERIADRFLREALNDSSGRRRLGVRGKYALHALVGLNEKKRERVENELREKLREANLPENDRIELAFALMALGDLAPASAADAAGTLVKAMSDARTDARTDLFRLSALASGLAALAERMEPQQAADTAGPLVKAMTNARTDVYALSAQASGLAALAKRMERPQASKACAEAAGPLVKAMTDARTDAERLSALTSRLAALAEGMDRPQANDACRKGFEALLPALKMSSSNELNAATKYLNDAVKHLLGGFPSLQNGRVAVTAIAAVGDGRGLPLALAVMALQKTPPPCHLTPENLVVVLKHPFCVDEERRSVLDQLENYYQRPFADHWEFVRFYQEQPRSTASRP
jgi:hypothetical protein